MKFYRAWGKRLLTLPGCIKGNYRRSILIIRGANIALTSEIGKVIIDGPKRKLRIGSSSVLGRVFIALHDHITIGANVSITDGVRLLTASHDPLDPHFSHIKREIVIEDYVWIGMGAIILPGVKLGTGCLVGAGSVVSKSVPPNAIVAGNPAKELTKKRCDNLKYNPTEFLAVNQAWLVG